MDVTFGAPTGIGGIGNTGGGSPPAGGKPAAMNDVERFQEAYTRDPAEAGTPPPEADGVVNAVPDAGEAQAAGSAADTSSPALGDRILNGLGAVSEQIRDDRTEAITVLSKKDYTQADLLRANFSMLESANVVTAVTKTAEKINQGIKTLQQG